jgi:hypothetical protein
MVQLGGQQPRRPGRSGTTVMQGGFFGSTLCKGAQGIPMQIVVAGNASMDKDLHVISRFVDKILAHRA